MAARISTRKVTFQHPFLLRGLSETQPPGSYVVETVLVYDGRGRAGRRTATFIEVKRGAEWVLAMIDPRDLDQALEQDRAQWKAQK